MIPRVRKLFISIAAMWISTIPLTRAIEPPSPTGSAEFKGCYARWNEHELVIGNAHFERKWGIDRGLLTATSFRDLAADVEWVAKPANRPAPYPAEAVPTGERTLLGSALSGRIHPVEEESLVLKLTTSDEASIAYRMQVFPAAHGVGIRFNTRSDDGIGNRQKSVGEQGLPSGIEATPPKNTTLDGDSLEDILLAPKHLSFTRVTLRDQTDGHNQLVFEDQWLVAPNEGPLKLAGNVFFVEDPHSHAGLLFLKQAPLPHARPVKSEWDAEMLAGQRRLRFAGQGYPFVVLAYSGGRTGRIEAIQTYQRQLRRYDPNRDGMFLSNTWGDRSRDARINEAFMLKEIDAGARLGVDVIQIDDGWQKGRTANSAKGKGVWNGYWGTDPDFWQPDPQRFPGGLAPVVKAARDKGMKFGLWYGPDSSNDASNWQRDADRILQLHKEHGIDYFKLDSVKAVTTVTERNLRHFWDRVADQSAGRVVFDLDVTAEIRPGYFGAPDVGPVFVENRYTDFHTYWPHQTLRNLWQLSQYVDPLRLRMEFLNNTRNPDKYANDPLAPNLYQPDYLFASVMCASPLGWFEASNLPEDYIASVSKLVEIWKRERSHWHSGTMIPIGDAPDGTRWTGFASLASNQRSGYLLIFRELNDLSSWSAAPPLFGKGPHRLTTLAGNGSAEINNGQITVKIPKPLDYVWLKVTSAEDLEDAWSFTPDPKLPNVLILGDSISIGYTRQVREILTGKANVYRPMRGKGPDNCGDTTIGLKGIEGWIGKQKWDVIHFNWGLWDLCYRNPESKEQGNRDKVGGKLSTTPADYEKNLEQLVTRLKATGAKLVWANTTVVPEDEIGRFAGDDGKYNAIAARVMEKHGIPTDDLFTLTKGFDGKFSVKPGDVHFTDEGSGKLAVQVAATIAGLLTKKNDG